MKDLLFLFCYKEGTFAVNPEAFRLTDETATTHKTGRLCRTVLVGRVSQTKINLITENRLKNENWFCPKNEI